MTRVNKNYYRFFLLLVATFLACPISIYGQKKSDKDDDTLISRSENVSGAFEDSISMDALAKKITNKKMAENADIVKKLKAGKTKRNNIQKSKNNYAKTTKAIGFAGMLFSLSDAYKNAYVIDKDGKKTFSKTKFFKNAVMNLSGATGLVSVYNTGMETKQKAFLKYLDEYEKEGKDITDPKYIYKALTKATGKALLVGAYEGAKCIPFASDAINVYELTESSVGLVYDTLQSKKIREENKQEQDRQAGASISRLKAILREAKSCRNLYDKQYQQANDMTGQFKKLRNQYTEIENRSVERNKQLIAGDELVKTCNQAKPFMEDKYLNPLKENSASIDQAVVVTLKLAETTLENYQQNGGDSTPLKKTSKELAGMLESMVAYKEECDKIVKVLNPLLGGADTLEKSQTLGDAADTDAVISNNLMQNTVDLVKLQRSLVKKCQKLRNVQQQIKNRFDNAYNYFSIHSKDSAQNKEINNIKNDLIGVMIKEYELNKLSENSKLLAADLRYWRKPLQLTEGMDPEISEILAKAANVAPEISTLLETLNSRIEAAKAMISRLNNPTSQKQPEYPTASNTPKLSDKEFANISTNELCEKASFINRTDRGKEIYRTACGFKYYKMNHEEYGASVKNMNAKTIPYYIGSYRKLVEEGTMLVWYDLNRNDQKEENEWQKEPYWIWYESINGPDVSMIWRELYPFYINQTYEREAKRVDQTHPFTAPNVTKGFVGIKSGNALTYDKKPYSYNMTNGFAFYPPFHSGVNLRVLCQVGPYSHFQSASFSYDEKTFWGYLKDTEKIRKRMAFWETGLGNQIKELLNESLTLPKQFTEFTEKHFYTDVREIFPNGQLNGFKTTSKFDEKMGYEFIHMTQEKTWPWNGRKARIRYYIRVNIRFPGRKDSWNVFLKKFPAEIKRKMSKRETSWNVDLRGVDFVKGWRIQNERKYTHKKKYSVYSINEKIYFIKANVKVNVETYGNGLPEPKLETETIARKILSNIKK
jgi:hypothetical protein